MPGVIIAKRNNAICRATVDGAIWIGLVKRKDTTESNFKLSASMALKDYLIRVSEIPVDLFSTKPGKLIATSGLNNKAMSDICIFPFTTV